MKYINAEQFQEQPKKVQEALLKWWQPSIGDLYKGQNSLYNCIDCCTGELISGFLVGNNKKDIIPLFTEGQLREFIETKSESKVRFLINPFTKTYVYTFSHDSITTHTGTDNLLQSYWKVVCKIAEEVANE